MASKLLNLLALSSIAIMACSFGATPTTALSVDTHNVVRHIPRSHDAIARSKRASGKRCKHRPSPPPQHKDKQNPPKQSKPKGKSDKGPSNKPPTGHAAPSSGHYKRGLAWPNGDDPSLSKYKTNNINWLYTWSPDCPPQAKKLGLECVPMLWGFNQQDEFKRLVKGSYARTVLGMNEVNQQGQAQMDVPSGVKLWQTYIDPLKNLGYHLVSPSTTSAPDGLEWIKQFLDQCHGCQVDAVALHWYDVGINKFTDYVKNYHDGTGKKVWVTEFACQNFNGGAQCSQGEIFDFLTKAMDFMDNTDYVEAYSAFGVMHSMQGVNTLNQLMAASGSPTSLGNLYINH